MLGKRIRVLLQSVVIYLLMNETAAADPISAIVAIAGALGSAGGFGAALLKAFVSIALSFASSLLQKMLTKKQKLKNPGVKLEIEMGDDLPISTTIGYYATAGRRKYAGTSDNLGGTPNALFIDVIELGNLPGATLDGLWVDDKDATILWNEDSPYGYGHPIKELRNPANGKDYGWIQYFDGTQTTASSYLMSKFGSHPDRPWKNDMIGRGCPYVIMTYRFNQHFYSGVPSCVFEMGPLPLYDIRKDSTAGGNGTHRWNNRTTWEPSQNPAVQIYNIIRGMYYGTQWFFGGQNLAAARLPASNWIAAAQECSKILAVTGQPSEPTYRAGYEITGEMEPMDVIEDLRAACAGRLAEVGGSFKLQVGVYGASVYSFTDENVLITKGQSFSPFPTLDGTHNAIEATYPEPAEKWAAKDAVGLYDDELEDEDGDRRLPVGVSFVAVPFRRQVQRLMRAMIKEERRFRHHQIYLPPDAWVLEPNDVISWTSEENGYINKRFVIVAIAGEMTMNQLVTIKEIDPTDYDWSSDFERESSFGPVAPTVIPPQPMAGWQVTADFIADSSNNARRPAIRVAMAGGLDDIARVHVTVRNKATGKVVFDNDGLPYDDDIVSPSWLLSGDWCLPNTEYEVQGVIVPKTVRDVTPSSWLPVTTNNLLIASDDIFNNAVIASKIADAAITASKIMDEAVTNLKIANLAVTTTKLAVAAVTADILASNAVITSKIADAAITNAKMLDGTIQATKFASSIEPVTVVMILPTTRVTGAVSYQGKLYRWNGTAYVVAVDASEVTGQISSAQIADSAITNTKLASLAVDAGKLANNAVTNTKIADDAISTPKLQANSVVADKIAANSISARQLILGDFSNMVTNDWTNGNLDGWLIGISSAYSYAPAEAAQDQGSHRLFSYSRDHAFSAWVTVTPGETYYAAAWMYNTDPQNGRIIFQAQDATGGNENYIIVDQSVVKNAWVRLNGQVTIPANKSRIRLLLGVDKAAQNGNATYWTKPILRRASSGELIVDGAITANKVSANAIVAGKIAANAVTANEIAANSITTAKIAAGAVSADQISANAIIASKIAAGAISADKLGVGTSNNQLPNADFLAGTTGWGMYVSGGNWSPLSIRTNTYGIPTGSLEVVQGDPVSNGQYADVYPLDPAAGNSVKKFTVQPGQKYELSVYVFGHRSDYCRAHIEWSNAAGTIVGYEFADATTHMNTDPAQNIANYTRLFVIGVAPSGAVSCKIFFRCRGNSAAYGSTSFTWLAHPYFGEAQPNQTQPSVWSSGVVTLIDSGNIVTGSVTTVKLAALAITADKIAAGAIVAGKIQAGSITGVEIAAETITGTKIAANTIGADKIAANSITAKQLVLTDFNNLVPDAQMVDATSTWNGVGWYQHGDHTLFTSYNAFVYNAGPWGSGGYTGAFSSKEFPVKPSTQYLCVGSVYSNNNYQGAFGIVWFDGTGAYIAYNELLNTEARAAGAQTGKVNVTAPANARRAVLQSFVQRDNTGGPVYFGGFGVFERNGAELIVDGGITADKIAANAITTVMLQAGSITTDKLTVGGVTFDKLAMNAATKGASNVGNSGVSFDTSPATIDITSQSINNVRDLVLVIANVRLRQTAGTTFPQIVNVYIEGQDGAFIAESEVKFTANNVSETVNISTITANGNGSNYNFYLKASKSQVGTILIGRSEISSVLFKGGR